MTNTFEVAAIECLTSVATSKSVRTTKIACFPQGRNPQLLDAPLGGIPSEFLDETCKSKTRGMGLLYGENCMIRTSTVFD